MLCEICTYVVAKLLSMQRQQIFVKKMTPVRGWAQVPESHQSQVERIKNCYVCKQLKTAIENLAFRSKGPLGLGIGSDSQLSVFVGEGPERSFEKDKTFIIHALSKDIHLARKSLLSRSSGSDEATALAVYWLKDCLLNHPDCNIKQETPWYPTQLLDVSTSTIRLINTAVEKPSGPYVTFSYCWGDQKFTVLSAENLEAFENGIVLSDFAANFEDAICITQRLGFQYIWIDFFCIIQDSASGDHIQDKILEIARMKDVYANGILNIGAAYSFGPYFGCFSDRDIYPGSNIVENPLARYFHPPMESLDESTVPFRIYSTELARVDANLLLSHRIFGRGWVLQERLLCRRVLHFGISQLHWECDTLRPASESFPCAEGHTMHDPTFNVNDGDLIRSPLRLWVLIVEQYMGMHLSFPSKDKLLAISAIAQRVAEVTNDDYIAGFLAKDMIMQLGWEATSDGRRSKSWRAPSWSWASLDDNRLSFAHITTKLIVDPRLPPYVNMAWIRHTQLELVDPNHKYGALKSASLVMEGRCIAVHPPEQQIYADGTPTENWKCPLVQTECCPLSVCVDDEHLWPSWGLATIPSLPEEAAQKLNEMPSDLYVLPLYMWFVTAEDMMSPTDALLDSRFLKSCASIHGLLVQKLSASVYVRRGCLQGSESDPEARDYEGLLRLWAAKENETILLF